jgi:hypothetical protein
MTLEELLEKHGIDSSEWQGVGGQAVTPTVLKEQQQGLIKLRGLLEGKVDADQKMVVLLRERLMRMKHGGGS